MRRLSLSLAAAAWLSGGAWAEGKVWAIVVGIDEYVRPTIPKLRYAVADAKLFAQALKDGMKVAPDNLFLMTSDAVDESLQPRVVNLAYRLGWLADNVKKEDTVIFYFAGHGMTVDGQPFLLTEEADNRSAATLRVSALHGGEVIGLLRKATPGSVWVVLDACRNSPNSKSEVRLEKDLTGAFSNADVGRERSATMFACNLGERSWEMDSVKHGCYTYFLVEGMRRQAADAKGQVTLQGLFEYTSKEVKAATQKMGTPQNPRMFYGGAATSEWVLTRVEGSTQPLASDQYVARLELLQARLDKETALRVAAEQKARAEESRRRELEQRVALMEKQLHASTGLSASQSEPHPLAYADRGVADPKQQQEAAAREIARLQEENRNLNKRLLELQSNLAKVGMISRDVQLLESLEQEKAEEAKLASTTGLAWSEQLEQCLKIRQSQDRQAQLLERASQVQLSRRALPARIAEEVAVAREKLKLQKLATESFEARGSMARVAIDEANARANLAEARLAREVDRAHYWEGQAETLGQQLSRARGRCHTLVDFLMDRQFEIAHRYKKFWEAKRDYWDVRGPRLILDVLDLLPPEAKDFKDPQRP